MSLTPRRTGDRRMRPAGLGFCVVALALVGSAHLAAHEIGTTRAAVTFPADGTYRIEVVTDASSLLDKLESAAGQRRSGVTDPAALNARIGALLDRFNDRVVVCFDGQRVRPSVRHEVTASKEVGGVPGAALILTGRRPAASTSFTWSYGWTFASYALIVRPRDAGPPTTAWLEGGDVSAPIALETSAPAISRPRLIGRYLALGFTHILPKGLDHVLFVLGVFLVSRTIRSILVQVSAFTVAHSITLGLGVYGIVSLSPAIVEPLIALSIAYIAIENLLMTEFRPWRVGLVFAFGLLHGLGFADALKEVGLPRSEFVTALLGFNIGVELGQLAVITGAFLAVGYWYSNRVWYRRRVVLPASSCIACFGLFWTLQRLHWG